MIRMQGKTCNKDSARLVTTVLHEFAESLGNAVDAKDPCTRQHSEEVAEIAHALALRMGVSPVQADIVHVAAHLHDVGKIGIPDAVLQKQGSLTPSEWALVRRHPVTGAEIVRPVKEFRECGVADIILHHHERWDGKGYPDRLQAGAIPLGARIITLADSLSAMMQDRPYRRARSFQDALEEIVSQSGTQFDPAVVEACRANYPFVVGIMTSLRYVPGDMPLAAPGNLRAERPSHGLSRSGMNAA